MAAAVAESRGTAGIRVAALGHPVGVAFGLRRLDRRLRAVRHLGFVMLAALGTWLPFAPTVFEGMTGVSVGVAFVLLWPLLSMQATDRRPGGGW